MIQLYTLYMRNILNTKQRDAGSKWMEERGHANKKNKK